MVLPTQVKLPRITQHDSVAVPIVSAIFANFGFHSYALGTESGNESLRQDLRSQDDRTSIMLRFRPDRVFVRCGTRSVLCEVKSESGRYSNFAIEVDSYCAAKEWNAVHNRVMYAFVDLASLQIMSCWANCVPEPSTIHVPHRWDFWENWHRLGKLFPRARLVEEDYRPSPYRSGTPYFLIPKQLSSLVPIGQFIQKQLSS